MLVVAIAPWELIMTIQTPDTLLLDGQQYRIPDILLDGWLASQEVV
mgnify:CR=1 FL=1